ncbi:hypothetical protein Patl1_09876 [Pistacia atlantica]|uniref:Uncharacterized protein n=1 Tax=Pistacia atlantica TaxID=434234 RepID=A0ACC1A332_9ROSI|nr:hypothetical protein Patl1_09876 [Pistacia atlantica]
MTKYEYLGKNVGKTTLHEAAANWNIKAVKLLVNHNKKLLKEDKDPNNTEFLEDSNEQGETPLFKATAYGRTKVVKFLSQELIKTKKVAKEKECTMLKVLHRQQIVLTKIEPQPDASNLPGAFQGEIISEPKLDATQEETFMKELDASILHIAIRGRHFDTALLLLNLDESLAKLKDKKGYTSLHLLATIPSAFKNGYRRGTWINGVVYLCLPIGDDENATSCLTTCLLIGDDADDEKPTRVADITGQNLCTSEKICEEKRKHKLAFKLAQRLIEVDTLWNEKIREALPTPFISSDSNEQGYTKIKRLAKVDNKPIPLLLATERGIVEIVNKILKEWPQLVESTNNLN